MKRANPDELRVIFYKVSLLLDTVAYCILLRSVAYCIFQLLLLKQMPNVSLAMNTLIIYHIVEERNFQFKQVKHTR